MTMNYVFIFVRSNIFNKLLFRVTYRPISLKMLIKGILLSTVLHKIYRPIQNQIVYYIIVLILGRQIPIH